jgi:hypothetical protein
MKKYIVKTKFVFTGVFEVLAENRQEALRTVYKDCGVVLGGSIHTSNKQVVIDWNFPVHPETIIVSALTKNYFHHKDDDFQYFNS